jgi:hypothetical protein
MLSEGVIYFVIFLVLAIPIVLVIVFASIAIVFWRQGKPRTGLLFAGLSTITLAAFLMPVFWHAKSFLEALSIRIG